MAGNTRRPSSTPAKSDKDGQVALLSRPMILVHLADFVYENVNFYELTDQVIRLSIQIYAYLIASAMFTCT
jgi:hypothetical protein